MNIPKEPTSVGVAEGWENIPNGFQYMMVPTCLIKDFCKSENLKYKISYLDSTIKISKG